MARFMLLARIMPIQSSSDGRRVRMRPRSESRPGGPPGCLSLALRPGGGMLPLERGLDAKGSERKQPPGGLDGPPGGPICGRSSRPGALMGLPGGRFAGDHPARASRLPLLGLTAWGWYDHLLGSLRVKGKQRKRPRPHIEKRPGGRMAARAASDIGRPLF